MIEEKEENHKLLTYFVIHRRIWGRGTRSRGETNERAIIDVRRDEIHIFQNERKFTQFELRDCNLYTIFHDSDGGNFWFKKKKEKKTKEEKETC